MPTDVRRRAATVTCLAPLLLAGTTFAHQITLSAAIEHDRLVIEARYQPDCPFTNAAVTLTDADEHVLASARTDAAGRCAIPAKNLPQISRVTVTGDGHKQTLTILRSVLLEEAGEDDDQAILGSTAGPSAPRVAIGLAVIAALTVLATYALSRRDLRDAP